MRDWTRGEPEIHPVPVLCDPRRASLDVGACLGTSAYLRRHSHSVIALEPYPVAAAWLRQEFGGSIQVLGIATSDATARIVLRVRDQFIDAVRGVEKVPGRVYVNNFFVHRDDPRRLWQRARMRGGAEHR